MKCIDLIRIGLKIGSSSMFSLKTKAGLSAPRILPVTLLLAIATMQCAQAAFIVECRSDGRGFANFSAPGGTPAASTKSTAAGCIAANSIFGAPHTYIWKYSPGVDVDNYSPSAGTALGKYWDAVSGQACITNVVATGTAGGGRGKYRVYACWPTSGN